MGSVDKTEGSGKLDCKSNSAESASTNNTDSLIANKDPNLLDEMTSNGPGQSSPEEDNVDYDDESGESEDKQDSSPHTIKEEICTEDETNAIESHDKSNQDEVAIKKEVDDKTSVEKTDSENKKEVRSIEYDEEGRRIVYVPETEISDEECGFPTMLRQFVLRGKTIPINKKTWTEIDIDGNDSILDCASQVVPLMIKKPNIFPHKNKDLKLCKKSNKAISDDSEENQTSDQETKDESSENVKEETEEEKQAQQNKATMLTISDFYKSNIGNFLIGIGLSRCKEWAHRDSIKQTQKLIRKEGELDEHMDELKKQNKLYNECKTANSIFNFKTIKCHMCDFKSESQAVMDEHYSYPHLTNRKEYKCNYCLFLTRDSRTIIYHFQTQHRKPCIIPTPTHLYECPTCTYGSNQKAKALAHMAKCTKIFNEEKVQATHDPENEYPAITPKPITQEDIKMYEATLQALRPAILNPRMAVPYVPGLPRGLQNQIVTMHQNQVQQQRQKMGAKAFQAATRQGTVSNAIGAQNNVAAALRSLQSGALSGFVNPQTAAAFAATTSNGSNLLSGLNFAKNAAPQLYHMLQSGPHAQFIPIQQKLLSQAAAAGATQQQLQQLKNRLPNANSIMSNKQSTANKSPSTVSLPGNKQAPATSTQNNSAASRDANSNGGKAGTFVICEICDGYIKDLEQLRTHMQWIHKVRIHPKMLASRPPLNCQKCQWRFFTDQGLERHLLGAHGLVTSNMQDMVDQNQDGGRCTICGRVFVNKLVAHMNQVHKITLRPAHLSYKCTVCSATFNLYRLFESHVYMVHSGSMKRNNEDPPAQISKKTKPSLDIKNPINGQEKITSAV